MTIDIKVQSRALIPFPSLLFFKQMQELIDTICEQASLSTLYNVEERYIRDHTTLSQTRLEQIALRGSMTGNNPSTYNVFHCPVSSRGETLLFDSFNYEPLPLGPIEKYRQEDLDVWDATRKAVDRYFAQLPAEVINIFTPLQKKNE